MRGENSFIPPMEAGRPPNLDKESQKDPAEILFDSIMVDVGKRKRAGENISFKTHPDYQKWLSLRNRNMAETPISPEQHRIYQARKTQEAKVSRDLERIAREQDEHEKIQAIFYRQRERERAELSAEIRALAEAIGQNLSNYRDKAKELEGLSFIRFLRKGELNNELADLLKNSRQLFEVLKEKVKISTNESDDKTSEAQALLAQMEALNRALSDTSAKDAVASGKIKWASASLVLLANLPGIFAHQQSARENIPDLGGKTEISASDEDLPELPAENIQEAVSESVTSEVSGYRVAELPSYATESSSVAGNREIYALTEAEAGKVNNFTQWRRAILNPEFVGKLQKDGSIPTTEKGLHTAIGTKVNIMVDGQVLLSMTVNKGESIWQVLQKNKQEIKDLAKEKSGFGALKLSIESPVESQTAKPKESPAREKSAGKVAEKRVGNKAGSGLEQAPRKSETPGGELDKRIQLEKASAKKILAERRSKYSIGTDYDTTDKYDQAIEELKKVSRQLEEEISPILDMNASDRQLELSRALAGVRAEIERLEEAKKALRIKQHQEMIDQEASLPQAATSEKISFESSPKVSDLASETDLSLKGGKYANTLINALNLVSGVDYFSSQATDDEQVKKFLEDAKAAEKIYANFLKSGMLDEKATSTKFIINQSKIGLKIARAQIAELRDSLPEKDAQDIIGLVRGRLNILMERNKDKIGNAALFGKNGALEIVQSIVINIEATGKISNSDKNRLKIAKRTAHIILDHNTNNSNSDRATAKDLLDIIKDLSKSISRKDQDNNIIEGDEKGSFAGVRYDLPFNPGTPDDVAQAERAPKNLKKFLSRDIQKRIDDAYELAGNLFDASRSSSTAADLVSAAALLEQLLTRPLNNEDIQDKLARVEVLLANLKIIIDKSTILPKEYASLLNQLNSTLQDTKTSLITSGVLAKEVPADKSGSKRVANAK